MVEIQRWKQQLEEGFLMEKCSTKYHNFRLNNLFLVLDIFPLRVICKWEPADETETKEVKYINHENVHLKTTGKT